MRVKVSLDLKLMARKSQPQSMPKKLPLPKTKQKSVGRKRGKE